MKPIRLLHIFPGKIWGGAEQYILDLGRALQADPRFEVSYMTRNAAPVTSRLDSAAVSYRLYSRRALEEAMKEADIVHIHDLSFVRDAVRARRRSGSPARIILTRHIARASRVLPWRRSALREIDTLLFVSELSRSLFLGANPWLDPARTAVIFNSIPPAPASSATEKYQPKVGTHHDASADSPLLMFTGRVRRSKGCETIVRALAQLSDRSWQMYFVGQPKPADYDRKLLRLAASLGIADRIHFLGFRSDARALAAQADIGLAPSIVREAFGLSPVEFMQQGKPVITTNNGAQPEYIRDGVNGLLVDPDDPGQLARAIARLLDDPALRDSIGRQAAESFRDRMSYPLFLEKITSVYLNSSTHHV